METHMQMLIDVVESVDASKRGDGNVITVDDVKDDNGFGSLLTLNVDSVAGMIDNSEDNLENTILFKNDNHVADNKGNSAALNAGFGTSPADSGIASTQIAPASFKTDSAVNTTVTSAPTGQNNPPSAPNFNQFLFPPEASKSPVLSPFLGSVGNFYMSESGYPQAAWPIDSHSELIMNYLQNTGTYDHLLPSQNPPQSQPPTTQQQQNHQQTPQGLNFNSSGLVSGRISPVFSPFLTGNDGNVYRQPGAEFLNLTSGNWSSGTGMTPNNTDNLLASLTPSSTVSPLHLAVQTMYANCDLLRDFINAQAHLNNQRIQLEAMRSTPSTPSPNRSDYSGSIPRSASSNGMYRTKSRAGLTADPARGPCANCETTITCYWRLIEGQYHCNACTLFFKRNGVHRVVDNPDRPIRRRNRRPRQASRDEEESGAGDFGSSQENIPNGG